MRKLKSSVTHFCGELIVGIPDVSDAARHAGREVSAGSSENDCRAARHVFAAVVADAFDDDSRTAVSDAEAFPGFAGDEGFAAGRAE